MNDSIHLNDLQVLALDCQATGPNPGKGSLLEIGWIDGWAGLDLKSASTAVQSHLIQMRPSETVPPVIQRLTGISDEAMAAAAVPGKTVWRCLGESARVIAARNRADTCVTLIHLARFETPFLRRMHAAHGCDVPFPLQIICTHQIALRLLPELPRRGIRAVAGYLGHCLPERKRSADHALATLAIWNGLVELLKVRHSISELDQLVRWLSTCPRPGRTRRMYPMNPTIRLALPDRPGIYRMRRSNADILYIGKAKSLKQRVNSYFRSSAAHPEHILEMLSQARDIDFTPTESALEAAVLESDEIKRHHPPYNKALRTDQRGLVFFSQDLKRQAPRCDRQVCIGPLPAGRMVDALSAFECWRTKGAGSGPDELSRLASRILGLTGIETADRPILAQGLERFAGQYRQHLRQLPALRVVTGLGARLRRERLAERNVDPSAAGLQAASDDGIEAQDETVQAKTVCTPDSITGAMEHMLMHWSLIIRRARWYRLLSEACLAWTRAGNPEGAKHLVIIEGAHIVSCASLSSGWPVPVPEGAGRTPLERGKNFDLPAYDRMRVLTTEIRRLVGLDCGIDLRLGPKVKLNATRLKKILAWV